MSFLQTELRALHSAVMFFTRIPMPSFKDYDPGDLQRSSAYFPLVGWLTGGAAALAWWGAIQIWPPAIASGASLAVTLLLTGAFHEDGFADMCDGFGSGAPKDRVLEIMRDSRIGAFGAIGLVVMLTLKWQAVAALPLQPAWLTPALLLAAHTVSRGASGTLMTTLAYVSEQGKAKPLATTLRGWRLAVSLVFALAPLALLPVRFWWTLVAVGAARAVMAWLCKRRIGGYTGDCLGATQQVCEAAFYLCAIALVWAR
ncbi:adenosylcobinamide-GDP ribazoletransferase [Ereboglobus sp. PH5-5]|uniref:adenosylcobinamide-GDP ribazoletransferase n=1 Tax=Ereboglobus sp. PH5-5 TaxID=2940529 RepID=UPI00240643A0|nr:adenosylcobinamide-GDP ribazoletransferase [Ereboglobus sp. PH5-5]MDF9831938.1 adenosylcobinamide-GDP ribazoletransferase [Ereboglobus sp. PH5-5]